MRSLGTSCQITFGRFTLSNVGYCFALAGALLPEMPLTAFLSSHGYWESVKLFVSIRARAGALGLGVEHAELTRADRDGRPPELAAIDPQPQRAPVRVASRR